MYKGYIKMHRKILDWEWYTDVPVKTVFIHLLLKANHKEKTWHGEQIKEGEVVTGRKQLAIETGLSEQEVRTALKKLKKTHEISTSKVTNRYSILTVCNYSTYQNNNSAINHQSTTNPPASNQQATTTKNDKNEKNEKKKRVRRFIPPTLTDIEQYIKDNGYSVEAKVFYNYFTEGNWVDSKGNKVKNWKQKIITWNNLNRQERSGRKDSPAPLEFNAETARQREQMMAELAAKMGVQD